MIPDLKLAFIRIQQMQIHVQKLFRSIKKQGIDFIPRDNKEFLLLYETLDEDSIDLLSSLKLILSNIQEEILNLNQQGCNVSSIEHGRFNWPCKILDKEILLTWHVGEKKVTHWCDLNKKNERKPLSELLSVEEKSIA